MGSLFYAFWIPDGRYAKIDGKDDLVIMCSFMINQVVASITRVKAMAVDLYFTQAERTVAASGDRNGRERRKGS